MKAVTTTLLIVLITCTSFAQMAKTDSISKSKIEALGFIVGDWKGTGWMMGKDGKANFEQTEKISFKLDSTAILIEGMGKANGQVVHNAMAILTYNKTDDNYTFRSYLPNGQSGEFKAELIDNKLYWYPNENVRYIIWLNENDQWYETGEYKRGEDWTQFFEMTLDRVM